MSQELVTYIVLGSNSRLARLKKFKVDKDEKCIMNASLDENTENIVLKDYINIGIAIDTPKGLIVPNIKEVNNLSISEISDEIGRMAIAAKDRKLKVDELKGSTFSVSSLGAIGGKFFTPIAMPGDLFMERRIRSLIRWNAMVLVLRANKGDDELVTVSFTLMNIS